MTRRQEFPINITVNDISGHRRITLLRTDIDDPEHEMLCSVDITDGDRDPEEIALILSAGLRSLDTEQYAFKPDQVARIIAQLTVDLLNLLEA